MRCARSGAAEREGLAAVFHQPHLDGCAGRAATPPHWHLHPNTRADVDQVCVWLVRSVVIDSYGCPLVSKSGLVN